ncbi:lipopolysaccharide biosynthesis protein [Aequorivita sediminis]|uniref:lipopolysaccharide biosynthesis protein n=1 Tax=Aequorivita sediminis TaxID=3073653 RepID=UPI0028ACB479|nr:hypothetical protein [Aequorivita sp. F6058]
MKLFKDILINNASQGLQFGSRWLLNLFMISALSIENFAVYSFVYSFSNIIVSVLPFGSSTFLISKDYSKDSNRTQINSSLVITLALFLVILLIYGLLSIFIDDVKGWELIIYGLLLGLTLSLNLILFSFFKGLGNFVVELFVYIFFSLGLLLYIGFYYFGSGTIEDVPSIFSFLITLNFLVFLATLMLKNKTLDLFNFKRYDFRFSAIKNSFIERKYFGYQEIVTAIYTQIGLLILFYILENKIYGQYRALFVVVMPFFMITVTISQVVLNQLKTLQFKFENMLSFFRKIQLFTVILGVLISVFLILVKDLIFQYIKIDVNSVINISYYIIVGVVFMRFVFSNYEMLLVTLDKQKERFWVMSFSAIVSLLLIFLILPQTGLIGAISINALAYFIVLIGTLYLSEHTIKTFKL